MNIKILFSQYNYMKILPIILTCLALNSPVCDYKIGNLIESDRYANVSICSEGKLFKEDIEIKVNYNGEEIAVTPQVNLGYSPTIFVGNFTNNGLEQVLYSVDSGGSGGQSFYQMFSFEDGKGKSIFNSNDFNPKIEYYFTNDNLVEINYLNKKLYLDTSNSKCQKEDCSLYLTGVNYILPYYNIALDRYFLQVFQRLYAGYSANTLGYVTTLVEVNENDVKTINIGTLSNFEPN